MKNDRIPPNPHPVKPPPNMPEPRKESLEAENARLKAEVERLTFDPLTYLDDQGEWMPRHIHLAAVERLKAENERLRMAGAYLCSTMEVNGIHDNGDISMHERAIALWNAAKGGQQNE